jgi:hypothetical protein
VRPLTVVRRRLRAQRLTGPRLASPAEAVAWSGAVQSQEPAEAGWSVGLRARGCTAADVEAAHAAGGILRTHVLRPTWHYVAAADLRWLLRLTGPRVLAGLRGRHRELGLTPEVLARSDRALAGALEDGEPRTRAELAAALLAAGIDPAGQRLAHVVMHAELRGIVCSGPPRGRRQTYALLDSRAPAAPERSREEDLRELAVRYFTSHGPATVRDLAWWSGLTVADARAGVFAAGELLQAWTDRNGVDWVSGEGPARAPRSTGALLLPTYDEAIVAYRDLRLVRPGGMPARDLPIRPLLLGGEAIGTWRRLAARGGVTVEATLTARAGGGAVAALEREARRMGRFLGTPAELRVSRAAGPR